MAHQFELTQREGGVTEWRHGGNGLAVLSWWVPVTKPPARPAPPIFSNI
jgi:hypothetical protein